jgi:hypothetical protein
MSLPRKHKLHRTLGIIQNVEQARRIMQQEIRAFVRGNLHGSPPF